MKYPKHLLLDFQTLLPNSQTPYWVFSYKKTLTLDKFFLSQLEALLSRKNLKQASRTTKNPKSSTYFLFTRTYLAWEDQLFNIHFLRKEKLYTKLKYSRCPQYDMVSGGLAALLSAFLGFLIAEKFGLELLDSADFYIFFMYTVFGVFSLRPLLKIINARQVNYWVCSPKYAIGFYTTISKLFFKTTIYYTQKQLKSKIYTSQLIYKWSLDHEYISTIYRKVKYVIRLIKTYPLDMD